MTAEIIHLAPKRQECRCAACSRAAARFPHDPPQLILPLGTGGMVTLYSVKARA